MLPEGFLREKKYDIGKVIAQGGMGAILNAKEATIERTVAMKVMLDTNDVDGLARFLNEAKITGQLEHPNIVPVHELSVDENGQPFYTMKMVRGVTLKKVLELMAAGTEATLKKYPLAVLLTIFQKVCDALAFAHSKGVIHRDLKPENLMLGDFGEVLLMDWGLAKVIGAKEATASMGSGVFHDASASATLVGSIMGTPQFMAPEQARGEVDVMDARSDIYSLGAILYQVLALRTPVEGSDAMEVVGKVGRGVIEPLALAGKYPHLPGGRIPDSLAAVVRKAMAFEQSARYAGVLELQRDLAAYQSGFATSAENAGAWKQFTLFVKRHKAASIGVAAVLVVGATLGTKAIVEGRRATREAARAGRGEAAARATLADLRRTAPVFYQQAKVVFDEGNFDEAVEKIGYAIELDDTQADYHLFRAHLRQSSQNLAQAAEDYRSVLALRPADQSAKTNLALCEKLLRESGGAPLARDQQLQLLAALRTQKRVIESAPLAALLDPDIAVARAALMARLSEVRKKLRGNDVIKVGTLPDGTFKLTFGDQTPSDFSVLKGQPVSAIEIHDNPIASLSGLAGLPLKELILLNTNVADLSPLCGMPLEILSIQSKNKVIPLSDLSPLRGMKLRKLILPGTEVNDLSPLAGAPLEELNLKGCQVKDLTPLAQCVKLQKLDLLGASVSDLGSLAKLPLTSLSIGGKGITSIAALAGLPLTELRLYETSVTDLSPLAKCATLEEFSLWGSNQIADLSPLGQLSLKHLACSGTKITSIAPLRGQPLRALLMENTNVTDLSPLADCQTLETLKLPLKPGDLSMLRKLPHLREIFGLGNPLGKAADFWREYDAKQAAEKK